MAFFRSLVNVVSTPKKWVSIGAVCTSLSPTYAGRPLIASQRWIVTEPMAVSTLLISIVTVSSRSVSSAGISVVTSSLVICTWSLMQSQAQRGRNNYVKGPLWWLAEDIRAHICALGWWCTHWGTRFVSAHLWNQDGDNNEVTLIHNISFNPFNILIPLWGR